VKFKKEIGKQRNEKQEEGQRQRERERETDRLNLKSNGRTRQGKEDGVTEK
jgi:hypothetical protein